MSRTARGGAPSVPGFARDATMLRDPAEVVALAGGLPHPTAHRLAHRTRGPWWEVLGELGVVLLVSREYEHLVLALSADGGEPSISYLLLPHPSGIAVDRSSGAVHVAATRNPNQVYTLRVGEHEGRAMLLPSQVSFHPGRLYLHDLAMIGGRLHGNAVGQNAVVSLGPDGTWQREWWPRCIEHDAGAHFERNYLQLNSIAAGDDLASSFFSASTDRIGTRRPGHLNFEVDGRGVIFSGRTREVVARGLTRPHSARLVDGVIWVDNSGYGEVGRIDGDGFRAVTRLRGWTRGLCRLDRIIFVGTSRVLPRFRHYAPGVTEAECGIHAIDAVTGEVRASLVWPQGNQIFAVDWIDARQPAPTLPFEVGGGGAARRRSVFYSFNWSPRRY